MGNQKSTAEKIKKMKYHFLTLIIVVIVIIEYLYFKSSALIDFDDVTYHYNFNYNISQLVFLLSAFLYAGITFLFLEIFLEKFKIARDILEKNKGKVAIFIIVYLFLLRFSILGPQFLFSDILILEIFGRFIFSFLLVGLLFSFFIIALSFLLFNHVWFKKRATRLAVSLFALFIFSVGRVIDVSIEYLFDSCLYFLVIFLILFFSAIITSKIKKIAITFIISFLTLIVGGLLLINPQIFFNSDFNKYCEKQSEFLYGCDIPQNVSSNVIKIIEDSCKSKGSGWVFDEAQDDYRCYKMGSGFIGF